MNGVVAVAAHSLGVLRGVPAGMGSRARRSDEGKTFPHEEHFLRSHGISIHICSSQVFLVLFVIDLYK